MTAYPSLKRWFAAGLTCVVIAAALYVMNRNGNPIEPDALAAQDKKPGGQDWVMYGGSPSRNMVNLVAKGLPTTWDADPKKPVNIKWVAELGSKAYGGPIVAGGRVFVGTNNQEPRDKKWTKNGKPVDLGVVMCFDEAKGAFNWQSVFEKLPGGVEVDWPREGIC